MHKTKTNVEGLHYFNDQGAVVATIVILGADNIAVHIAPDFRRHLDRPEANILLQDSFLEAQDKAIEMVELLTLRQQKG